MALHRIKVSDTINQLAYAERAEHLNATANDAIEVFLLDGQPAIEGFATFDFHLLDQVITWIHQNHLLSVNRFCALGAGLGVGTMLVALRGMESVGIEIEHRLSEQASRVADELGNTAKLYCGSFVPRGVEALAILSRDLEPTMD